ncbi:M15 family metallopeptidase [Cognaticolwellia mytili]|uniref:M15 family metallopeptidase n=1 Tax=Cognaticolwellia mytili TaxID=1888913 RepID=UPI000A171423|nr:M15 family metallopeptidase [Cognaticolwellia mytili]
MTELEKILTGQSHQHIYWLSDNVGIHHDMLRDYKSMQAAAKAENIELKIASGFRDFSRQLAIWNNKFIGRATVKDQQGNSVSLSALNDKEKIHAIMLFSALPGASRHHWGCDIDVYAPNLLAIEQTLQLEPWEYQAAGPLYPLALWLTENANKFGFYFPYNKFRGGVAAEPWHLSYQPIAKQYQHQHSETLLAHTIANSDIQGKIELLRSLPNLYQRYICNVASYQA